MLPLVCRAPIAKKRKKQERHLKEGGSAADSAKFKKVRQPRTAQLVEWNGTEWQDMTRPWKPMKSRCQGLCMEEVVCLHFLIVVFEINFDHSSVECNMLVPTFCGTIVRPTYFICRFAFFSDHKRIHGPPFVESFRQTVMVSNASQDFIRGTARPSRWCWKGEEVWNVWSGILPEGATQICLKEFVGVNGGAVQNEHRRGWNGTFQCHMFAGWMRLASSKVVLAWECKGLH